MIPLFKTHYSIGKSILTLNDPNKCPEGGSDSVFGIAKDNNLDRIVLVEDSLIGFFEAYRRSKQMGIQLTFGLRLSMRNSIDKEDEKSDHKIVIFAKNDKGCKLLNRIYSEAFSSFNGFLTYKVLKDFWNEKHLKLTIPFYDSFIYFNNFEFNNIIPDFSFAKPNFFIESNNVSIDFLLRKKVEEFVANKYPLHLTKSIYYKNKKDFEAFMTYKILCNRSFGKNRSLSRPELTHFCSDEFSFESCKQQSS